MTHLRKCVIIAVVPRVRLNGGNLDFQSIPDRAGCCGKSR